MRDIRLEEIPFELDGRTYKLRSNMNVLAEVQSTYGGSLETVLSGGNPIESLLAFLTAMLNDYADEQGWPDRYTAKQLGRRITFPQIRDLGIMQLVIRSLTPDSPVSDPDTSGQPDQTPEPSGN